MAEIDKELRGDVPEGFVKGAFPLHWGVGACPTVLKFAALVAIKTASAAKKPSR